MRKITITLDTNSIIDLEKNKDSDLKQLYDWHKLQLIEIVKTDVADTELGENSHKSADFKEDIGDGVIDNSRIGFAKMG